MTEDRWGRYGAEGPLPLLPLTRTGKGVGELPHLPQTRPRPTIDRTTRDDFLADLDDARASARRVLEHPVFPPGTPANPEVLARRTAVRSAVGELDRALNDYRKELRR